MRKERKRAQRKIGSLLLTGLILLCLASCGGNRPQEELLVSEPVESILPSVTASPEPEESEEPEPAVSAEESSDPEPADPEPQGVTPSVCGALQVLDGQLCDSSGTPVQLRGISTHGLAWYPEYVNQECFSDLHSWSVNVIRLALYPAESGGYCTDGDQEQLKELVRDGIRYAAEEDLYVIVDWHVLSEGNPKVYQSQAEDFFEEISAEFADYDNILYEICNEPNSGASWSDIKEYAESIIPIIRSHDPDAVIIVGTPTWSQELNQAAADPITGYDNLMYSLHFYAATHQESLRNVLESAAESGLPVFVTEFGICDASGSGALDEDSAGEWIRLMNQYQISFVMWNLSNKDESSALIQSSVGKTSGFTRSDLSDSGKWFYDLLTQDLPSSGESVPEEAEQSVPVPSETAAEPASPAEGSVLTNRDVELTLSLANSWQSGDQYFYQYQLSLRNVSGADASSWQIEITFSEEFQISDCWNGSCSADGSVLTICSLDYNGSLENGASASDIGFILSGSSSLHY